MNMFMDVERAYPSQEAIAFQGTTLFDALAAIIGDYRKKRVFTDESLKESGIAECIQKFTNIQIKLNLSDAPDEINDAMVAIQPLEDVNPLMSRENIVKLREYYMRAAAKSTDEKPFIFEGIIDRKTGKVSGVYSRMVTGMYLGKAIIADVNFLTDAEVAALIIHEVGHVFSHYEYLGRLLTMNFILGSLVETFQSNDPYERRRQVLIHSINKLELPKEVLEMLSTDFKPDSDAESTVLSLMTGALAATMSATGTSVYDARSWEQLADQFSVRHGAGAAQATGLDKCYRRHGHLATMSKPTALITDAIHQVIEISQGLAGPAIFGLLSAAAFGSVVGGAVIGAGMAVIKALDILYLMATSDPRREIYDSPKQRIITLRRQMTEELKLKNLSKARRARVLEDLKVVDNIDNSMSGYEGFFTIVLDTLNPRNRDAKKMEKFQKKLEELVSNRLFITSAQFTQAASGAS